MSTDAEALPATATRLARAFADIGPHRPPLAVGRVSVESDPPAVAIDVAGVRTVRLSPGVLRRADAARMHPVTLTACALAERNPLDDQWTTRAVGTGAPPAEKLFQRFHLRAYTTVTLQLDRDLEAGVDTVVCGDHGSGASELVAAWAVAREASGDRGLIWLSPSDPADGAETIYEMLLRMEQRDAYLVVVDGVQSNPQVMFRIRGCVEDLRETYGLKVVLVATAWPSVVDRMAAPFKGMRRINADGAELVELLLRDAGLTEAQHSAFTKLVGANVHLALAALDLFRQDGEVPDRRQLRVAATGGLTEEGLREALYWFACLGVFEIDVPKGLAERRFRPDRIADLVARGLLFLSDGAYTIGSRARAGLVLEQARYEWNAEARWGDAAGLVWTYLNSSDEATIIAMLERMDLVGLVDDPRASEGTRYLAMTWDQRTRLVKALASHYLAGGNWDDCIGAAVFSAQVFAEVNDVHAWRAVSRYVRPRFAIGDERIRVVDSLTSDYTDFPAIVAAMSTMDRLEPDSHVPGWEWARDIDVERFYLNWVLGLQLGFEGDALDRDESRLDRLLAIAEIQQDKRDGWFYPRRVPWVTARIVLGLCRAGQTYHSSPVVKLACDWLRRPRAQGGALDDWWRSGTGHWNTDEATTAMALTALYRAKAPIASSSMPTALAWLLGRRSEWGQPNHEVDLALVVEALLLYQPRSADLQRGVLALLQWALNVPDGVQPTANAEVPEGNLRLPFVAAQLTVVIWVTMMRELSEVIAHELRAYTETAAGAEPALTVELEADAMCVHLDDVAVSAWHRAADVVREKLAERLANRERSRATPEVAERIDELRAQLNSVNELNAQVASLTPLQLLAELDALGRVVCGDRWPNPPWPDRPTP